MSALLVVTLTASAHEPPCLSSFQRVATLAPMSFPTEQLIRVEVDGDVALAISRRSAPAPTRAFLHVFEQRPAPLGWVATQSVEIPGIHHVGAGNPDLFELEGHRAIAFSVATRELLVLEPDPLTGDWGPVFALPYPVSGGITRARLGGDRIAVSSEVPERIDIWRRAPNGTYSIEDVLTPLDPPNSYNFTTEFDFDGERLLHNDRDWLDVYSPDPTGSWRLATWFNATPHASVSLWFERTFLDGDRIAQVVGTHATGVYEIGIGFWRVHPGLATRRAIFDGALYEAQLGGPHGGTHESEYAAGTFIDRLDGPWCGTLDPVYRPLAVLAPGRRDEPAVRGRICSLGGLAGTGDVRDFDYDGRTLALAVPYELGAAPNHVRFARLLGADLDRNANCIEDSVEIAAQPALDWNTNGRLDTSERRGVLSCAPSQPNSTGRAALLELVGTEFADSSDLYAAGSDLPPLALALLFVARDSSTAPASGPLGLCLGAPVARMAVSAADPNGRVAVALDLSVVPTVTVPVAVQPGETWSWQLAYRDSGGFAATGAAYLLFP